MFRRELGALSMVDDLSQRLLRRWVPKWYEVFCDPDGPLFIERVGPAFKPIATGRRRLLTQLRQLAIYAHAKTQPECSGFNPDLKRHIEAIIDTYAAPLRGSWLFSVSDTSGNAPALVDEVVYDLYTHAFVIFALAFVARARTNVDACGYAVATLNFITTAMVHPQGGFFEGLDSQGQPVALRRRHESHMHLLEACLFAHETWGQGPQPVLQFMACADDMVQLFITRFYNAETGVLSEYLTDALMPLPDAELDSVVCEAGHYYEWIWLLKKHAALKNKPEMHDTLCLSLLSWANTHGWDEVYGGIFDEQAPDGRVLRDTKRLWPFSEALKANALLLDHAIDRVAAKQHMARMTRLFRDKYMQERGFWTEWLTRDLRPAVDYMPGTTPYHVYFGIMEARGALAARGASKSWRTPIFKLRYSLGRALSGWVRKGKAIKIS